MRVRPLLSKKEAEALQVIVAAGRAALDASSVESESKKLALKYGQKVADKVDAAMKAYDAAEEKKKEKAAVAQPAAAEQTAEQAAQGQHP